MDDNSLFLFKKTITLAGPSKLLMKGFYVGLNIGHKACLFRNKFVVPFYEEAEKERAELNAFLRKNNTVL